MRFRVRVAADGGVELTTLEIVSSPNSGFASALRRDLEGWRDPALAGHMFEHTVLFIMMDTAATDSVSRCGSKGDEWIVCARRVPPHVIRDAGPVRSEPR